MKIWRGFGTEHSMNLVMVGRFRSAADAETVLDLFEALTADLQAEERTGRLVVGKPREDYSDEVMSILSKFELHSLRPRELEQFLYDLQVRRDGDAIVITTDEIDVEAPMKFLLAKGAKVEVYSAHDYPHTEYGRGK